MPGSVAAHKSAGHGGAHDATEGVLPALREQTGVSSAVLKQVGMEVLRQDLEPAAWARALVAGSGTRDDTLSHYARIRVKVLTEQEGRRNRQSDFDVRQKSSFRDLGSVPVVPSGAVVKQKVLGCIDAVFWHGVAIVAGVGTLAAAGLLWPELRLELSWQFLAGAVVAMQLIPLIGWRVGRGKYSGMTYSQASQLAACLAMLGSVAVGLGLLMQHPPQQGLMAGPHRPPAAQDASDHTGPPRPDLTTRTVEEKAMVTSEERRPEGDGS